MGGRRSVSDQLSGDVPDAIPSGKANVTQKNMLNENGSGA